MIDEETGEIYGRIPMYISGPYTTPIPAKRAKPKYKQPKRVRRKKK